MVPRVPSISIRGLWRTRGELVEFRTLKVTYVLVSLACPISSDVFINAKRHGSEESLVMSPMNCAPYNEINAWLPIAPTVASPTAGTPITPATTPLPALAVPVAYANSPQQPGHRSKTLSTHAVSFSLQWMDTPSQAASSLVS